METLYTRRIIFWLSSLMLLGCKQDIVLDDSIWAGVDTDSSYFEITFNRDNDIIWSAFKHEIAGGFVYGEIDVWENGFYCLDPDTCSIFFIRKDTNSGVLQFVDTALTLKKVQNYLDQDSFTIHEMQRRFYLRRSKYLGVADTMILY